MCSLWRLLTLSSNAETIDAALFSVFERITSEPVNILRLGRRSQKRFKCCQSLHLLFHARFYQQALENYYSFLRNHITEFIKKYFERNGPKFPWFWHRNIKTLVFLCEIFQIKHACIFSSNTCIIWYAS